jgi:hypothetical protein
MRGEHDPEYVEARRILLDALEAIGHHRKAVVLVGAQAIYLRVGEGSRLTQLLGRARKKRARTFESFSGPGTHMDRRWPSAPP